MGEVKVQSHKVGPTSYRLTFLAFHVNRSSHSGLGYSFFKIWPWKFKVKVLAQGHKVGPASYRLTFLSFHINWSSHSRAWNTAFSKSNLGSLRSRSWERSTFGATKCVPSIQTPFATCQSGLLFRWYGFINIWHWKSKVKFISSWCYTTTGLDNSAELRTV